MERSGSEAPGGKGAGGGLLREETEAAHGASDLLGLKS